MMMKTMSVKKFIVILIVLLCSVMTSFAQSRHKRRLARVDSVLQERRKRPPIYDTTYIVRPDYKLTMKVRANLSGNGIHSHGTVKGIYTKADLHTSNKQTFSVVAIYQGISAGIALNPAKIFGHYHDYELNLNLYSSQISFDASFQRSKSLSGDIERGGDFHLESGYADMKVFNLAAYYAFNYRHFSYSAAFTQSHIQRRSAGSWLAGLAFQGGYIQNSDDCPASLPDLYLRVRHLGIGGGYGYNLVLGNKWMFHLSALPTMVVLNYNKFVINGERQSAQPMRLNLILNERLSVVHNFSSRYFFSVTGVVSNSLFDDNLLTVKQVKWRVRTSLGMRL